MQLVPVSALMHTTVLPSPVWGCRGCLRDQLEMSPHHLPLPQCLPHGDSARVGGCPQAWSTRVMSVGWTVCVAVCMSVRVGYACLYAYSESDNLGSSQLVPESSVPHVWLVIFRPETAGGDLGIHPRG